MLKFQCIPSYIGQRCKDYIHGYIECEIVPLKEIQKINLNVRKEGKHGNNFIKISNWLIWLYDIIK